MKIRLNELLQERGMSMYALSEKTGITYCTIHRTAMKNVGQVKFETLEKICLALDCGIEELLEIEKDNKGE